MRQIFYFAATEDIYKRACELRDFGDCGDISWVEWYRWNQERTRMSSGELEQAVAEVLEIPAPARYGFAVTHMDSETVIITDLEETGACDLNDASDAHLVLPVEQFREWLYNWNRDPLNKVMDTTEAAAYWGYASADVVKELCRKGKVRNRKLTNGAYIIDRNQPSPKQVK